MKLWSNQRSLRNLIQDPSLQWQMLLWAFVAFLAISAPFLFGVATLANNFEVLFATNEMSHSHFQSALTLFSETGQLIFKTWIVVIVICLFFILFMSHRIGGPSKRIKQQIKNFINNDYSNELTLRKNDMLSGISEELEHYRKKQSGFTLVETMIVVAVISIVGLGVSQLVTSMGRVQSQITSAVSRDQIINEYASYLGVNAAIINTVAGNAVLSDHTTGRNVRRTGTFNPDTNTNNMNFFDQNNDLLIPDTGLFLNKSGSKCAVTPINPSGSCPQANSDYRIDARWVAGAAGTYTIEIAVRHLTANQAAGQRLVLRPLFARRTYSGTGLGDAFTIRGTNRVTGLDAGATYFIDVMGFSRERGTGNVRFNGLRAETCTGGTLFEEFSRPFNRVTVNTPDGHARVSSSFILPSAPASGCIRVRMDGSVAPDRDLPLLTDRSPNWYTITVVKLQ